MRGQASPDSLRLYRAVVAEAERAPELGRLYHEAGPRRLRILVADLLSAKLGPAAPERAEQFVQIALGDAYSDLLMRVEETLADALSERFARQVDAAVEIALR